MDCIRVQPSNPWNRENDVDYVKHVRKTLEDAVPNMKPTDELIQGIADLLEWNDACKAAGSQDPAE